MEIKSFDTILTQMGDDFDTLIAPSKIARSNTNIFYLIFKAISKGFELINNVCVVLSNKFNPAKCSAEDLESVASITGTERLKGSASGLTIIITNPTEASLTLPSGLYTYALDEETKFIFEVIEDTVITAGSTVDFIAMSEEIGSYPVTEQASISVTADVTFPSDLQFACEDNSALLGTPAETDLAFRQRILSDTTRQDTLKELELKLKNLPYLYDAKVIFNNTVENKVVGDYTLPSFTMLIFFSGSPRSDIAEIVASSGIYPTLSAPNAVKLRYVNDVFVEGYYEVNIIPFSLVTYALNVNITVDTTYITVSDAETQLRNFLQKNLRGHIHQDYLKEDDIYTKLKEFSVAGIDVLNIDIIYNNEQVPYIAIPSSAIPYLGNVNFSEA